MTARQKKAALAGALALCCALAVLAAARQPASRTVAAPQQVIIAVNSAYVGACPILVAQQRQYFADQGIKAVIQRHDSGKSALEAAIRGEAQLATTADIPIVFAALNHTPVAIVATLFRNDRDHGIIGRRDRGIDGGPSLKGKRVGVTVSTSGHFVLDAYLNRHMLSGGDVTITNLGPSEFAGALERGEVDAVATWEPFLGRLAKQLGRNGIALFGDDIYEIPYSLAGRRAYLEQHGAAVQKVLRAIDRGAKACEQEPEAALAIMGSALQVNTDFWRSQWPGYRFKLTLDQGLILALEDEARWAISKQLALNTELPNFLDYLYMDAMDVVAPSAVTVIH